MPDQLAVGLQWLSDQLMTHAATLVTYQRGQQSVQVPAVIGRSLLKLSDGYGNVRMEWTDRDFIFRTRDLVLDQQPIRPQPGDLIWESNSRYEVMAPAGEPHWRWSDPYRQLIRVHTKLVGTS